MAGTLEPTSFYLMILTVILLASASVGSFYVQFTRSPRVGRHARTWVGASIVAGIAAMVLVFVNETFRSPSQTQLVETSGCTEQHPLPRLGC
jgi:hypothetical protein